MPHPPTSLTNNQVPTEEEWTEAVRLGRRIIRAVDERDAIIADRGLGERSWKNYRTSDGSRRHFQNRVHNKLCRKSLTSAQP